MQILDFRLYVPTELIRRVAQDYILTKGEDCLEEMLVEFGQDLISRLDEEMRKGRLNG